MANFMTKYAAKGATGIAHLEDHRSTLGCVAISKLEKWGGAAAFGYLKGAYREEFAVKGIPGDLIAGVALTGGAAILQAFSGGKSRLAPHASNLGDAAMMSWIGAKFTGIGARKSGRRMYMLPKGAAEPKTLPAGMTAVGGIDPIGGGAYLTPTEVAHFSSAR